MPFSLHLFDYDGSKLHVFTDYESLATTRQLNQVGKLVLTLPYTAVQAGLWQQGRMLEVWRTAGGVTKLHNNTAFFVNALEPYEGERGQQMMRVTAYDAMWLLQQRIIAYPAGSAQSKKSGAASDVMKALVRENLGALCVDPTRIITDFEVDEDTGYGVTVEKGVAWRNLLLVLQELAVEDMSDGERVYFDVVYLGNGKFRFQTFENQRGVNFGRSGDNPKFVGRQYGNLIDLSIKTTGSTEATFVYCGGQGQEEDRVVMSAGNSDAIEKRSPFGRIEIFADARNEEEEAAIQSEANSALNGARFREYISGKLVDTNDFQFGLDYDFGDVLSVEGFGTVTDCIVESVGLTANKKGDTFEVKLAGEIGVSW